MRGVTILTVLLVLYAACSCCRAAEKISSNTKKQSDPLPPASEESAGNAQGNSAGKPSADSTGKTQSSSAGKPPADSTGKTRRSTAGKAQNPDEKAQVNPAKNAPESSGGKAQALSGEKSEAVKAASKIEVESISLPSTKPANILIVLPMPTYSHTQNFIPIFKELARRGHNITFISPYPLKDPPTNWENIVVKNYLVDLKANMGNIDLTKKPGIFGKVMGVAFFGMTANKMTLELDPLIEFYKDQSRTYDLVFVEAMFVQEPLLAFGHKFGAPVIALFPSYVTPDLAYYTGNPFFTFTYVPSLIEPFSKHMTFVERAENTFLSIMKLFVYNFIYLPKMDTLMREKLPADNLPYIGDMLFNVSLTLMDTNEIIGYPFPRANNIKTFLGINTKPSSPLPKDLQEILDAADEGLLYFSLGSSILPSELRPHIIPALLKAFSRLPYTVLMKWDKDDPPADLPPNVKLAKWFPQSAILAHKNCRAFLSHTGVHGLVETVDHATPIISIPLFADQRFYAKWIVETGLGTFIDIETVTPEIAYEAISDVLIHNYDKYKKNIVEISKLFRDVPQPKLEEIVYWVEYVIRNKDMRHLRPGSLDLPWYARFGFDLLAAALAIILVSIWILLKTLSCLVSMCRGKRKPETKKDKAKKEN